MGQILRRCIILVLDEFAFLMFLFEERRLMNSYKSKDISYRFEIH